MASVDTGITAAKLGRQHWTLSVGRAVSSFPALITAAVVAKVYWTCRDRIVDPDLWWHFRNAHHLLTTGHFPTPDIYTYTTAGSPWVAHEWLSEVFYYLTFRSFGLPGVFALFATALAILVIAVLWLCFKANPDPFAAAISAILGGLLAMAGFGPRTQHFGWLCFVALYAILIHFRSTRRGPLWMIPLIFLLWINLHGSWLIGLVVYTIVVLAGLVPSDIGRLAAHPWSRSDLKKLTLTGVASVAALFANPFSYRVVMYPFDVMSRQTLGLGTIDEWASVNFHDPRGKIVAAVLGVIFALASAGRQRWRIDDVLLAAVALYCGLTHIRLLVLTGIVLPPILASKFGKISSYDPQRERRFLNTALLAVAGGVILWGFPSAAKLQAQVTDYFPVRATEFLRRQPQQGNIFHLYHWGGYLEWYLPEVKTFADGRADIFEYKGVLKDYIDATQLNDSQEILDRYHVSYVLYAPGTPLAYYLSKSSQWERIYGDEQAVIFRRLLH